MPNTRQKNKDADALYNTHELVLAAQQAYSKRFLAHISVEKIRFLYTILFELIMLSVAKGDRVDLYKFGIFKSTTSKGYTIPKVTDPTEMCYVSPRKIVHFRMSKRFSNIMNGRPVDPVIPVSVEDYEEDLKRQQEDEEFEKRCAMAIEKGLVQE